MTEHTWKQVLTPYALMGGTAGAMMAYLAWWHRMNPPGTEVRVSSVSPGRRIISNIGKDGA